MTRNALYGMFIIISIVLILCVLYVCDVAIPHRTVILWNCCIHGMKCVFVCTTYVGRESIIIQYVYT
jgi:hypothetical protein